MQTAKVGITGLAGFMGSHLRDRLTREQQVWIAPFQDDDFSQPEKMKEFLTGCDVVVHLAAMNRGDENELVSVNVNLVKKLVEYLESIHTTPHVIFASSTQRAFDNPYGRSKKEGEAIFEAWSKKNNAPVTILIIPNVYGDRGLPFYNSAVATFCYQLTHNQTPEILVDRELSLIYINELTEIFWETIKNPPDGFKRIEVQGTANAQVSEILQLLHHFRACYYDKKIVPALTSTFQQNLYNVFISYAEAADFEQKLTLHTDERGCLFEVIKQEKGSQVFFSTTKPGVVRGNHYHTRKIEKFCVVDGKAVIRLRRIGTHSVFEYQVSGDEPAIVEIPIFYTHNIENVGMRDLQTLFWANEVYDPADGDTFFERV